MTKIQHPLLARWFVLGLLVSSTLVGTGCRMTGELNEAYGMREHGFQSASINGTSLLGRMFELNSYDVRSWGRLSRRLGQADVVVWFAKGPNQPTLEQSQYLDRWLAEQPGRTLIFVGSGYHAGEEYWREAMGQLSGEQAWEAHRRLADARLTRWAPSVAAGGQGSNPWMTWNASRRPGRSRSVGGPWSSGEDSADLRLPYRGWLRSTQQAATTAAVDSEVHGSDAPGALHHASSAEVVDFPDGDQAEVTSEDDVSDMGEEAWAVETPQEHAYRELLLVDDEPFVWEWSPIHWHGSRLIVVNNGSFLVNYALTKPAHQRLAQRLIEACERPAGQVIFLEAGPEGPSVSELQDLPLMGIAALSHWPMGPILVHWLLVGILFCLAMFPIFGRPRSPIAVSTSNFGDHIRALGQLLSLTRDHRYARQRIQQFRQQTGRTEEGRGNPFRAERSERPQAGASVEPPQPAPPSSER